MLLDSKTTFRAPSHEFRYSYACYESNDVRVDFVVDDDVGAYVDFNKEEIVWSVRDLPKYVKHKKKCVFAIAKFSLAQCHSTLGVAKKADPNTPKRQEAPDVFIYSRYDGEDGVVNTLYCRAAHFYPPTINFTWTVNGAEVTEGVSDLRYRHDRDGTFHKISTLRFTPREGDSYSCTVEHQAAPRPLTRSWELKEKKQISVSPAAVFLGVSLVLCLMGITIGVFFYNKQPNRP
ncbi:H-2 class II histocompatibility antigen, E-U alpha chain-like isoform X4 [Embiotoca jacksoni]|uniref:H-2 class II histocompatibility antigen, E-U alpha chain-like isoform X4 n=1 Tax=Embiotoca jacksoni TaxID=100190 RepID=UPI0037045B36